MARPSLKVKRKTVADKRLRIVRVSAGASRATAGSMLEAQQSLDTVQHRVSDARGRRGSTVGELGASEPMRPLPALAFPAEIVIERVASRGAPVVFETNKSQRPARLRRPDADRRARVDEPHLRIQTTSGIKVATHRRSPAGAEQTIRSTEHATQLEQAVLDAFTTQTACRSKLNRPPGAGALAELAKLHGLDDAGSAPVVSLTDYAKLATVAC